VQRNFSWCNNRSIDVIRFNWGTYGKRSAGALLSLA
jgi:hypothetical protein